MINDPLHFRPTQPQPRRRGKRGILQQVEGFDLGTWMWRVPDRDLMRHFQQYQEAIQHHGQILQIDLDTIRQAIPPVLLTTTVHIFNREPVPTDTQFELTDITRHYFTETERPRRPWAFSPTDKKREQVKEHDVEDYSYLTEDEVAQIHEHPAIEKQHYVEPPSRFD